MKPNGQLTAEIGEHLRQEFSPKGYDVFYDHGEHAAYVGEIVSSFGEGLQRETELSQLDIAVVKHGTEKAYVLIEIEETNDEPKTFLADAFGALCGERISFHGEPLSVGDWTTLIVMGKGSETHRSRNDFLAHNIRSCQLSLSTANKWIKKLVIESFDDDTELEQKVRKHVETALPREIAIE